MSVERELIITLLSATRNGSVSQQMIKDAANLPSAVIRKLLAKLQESDLVNLRMGLLGANDSQRIKLAVQAIELGADPEHVGTLLQWREFESLGAIALERGGYSVDRNLRFRYGGRRYEIDLIGYRKPLAVCVDCKHWRRGIHSSVLKRIIDEQLRRISALADALPDPKLRMKCVSWTRVLFVPAVLSLHPETTKLHEGVPVVSVMQLQDFLDHLMSCLGAIKTLSKEFNHNIL